VVGIAHLHNRRPKTPISCGDPGTTTALKTQNESLQRRLLLVRAGSGESAHSPQIEDQVGDQIRVRASSPTRLMTSENANPCLIASARQSSYSGAMPTISPSTRLILIRAVPKDVSTSTISRSAV